jgi:lysylphosphatidylglycerol synthase-like protein
MMTGVPRIAGQPPGTPQTGPRRSNVVGIVATVVGVILFAWFVRQVGPGEIWSGLGQVGWGFAAIIALAGLRFAMRAAAWARCLEPPHALPFRTAFTAVVVGDAIGNLTPLGLFASEPAKAAFVRDRVPLGPSLTALAIENIFYTLSAAAMIGASTMALLVSFTLPPAIWRASAISLVAIAVGFVVTALLLWRRPVLVRRTLSLVVPSTSRLQDRIDQLHELESQIYTFVVRRRRVLVPLVGAEVMFHVLGVLEVHLTWWLILGAPPPLLTSFIFEGANRLVQVLFKFVPLRTGVDELTTGNLTQMLGFGAALGTTMAIVRKIRTIVWVLVGTSLLIRRSLRARR